MSEQATQTEKRCRIEGCKRPYRAKSYCNVHYRQWRQGKLRKARFKICTKEECLAPREARGLCKSHLEEWRASRGKDTPPAEASGSGKAEVKEAPPEKTAVEPEAKADAGDAAPGEEVAEEKASAESAGGETAEAPPAEKEAEKSEG